MKALTQKGYDVNYSWSMNLHGQKFGGMILPEMMRWLWRDGPVSTDPNDMVERGLPPARDEDELDQRERFGRNPHTANPTALNPGVSSDAGVWQLCRVR